MNLVRKTPATASCITADLVMRNERAKHSLENDLVTLWISAAEELIEARTNRSIMAQTFVLRTAIIRPRVTLFRPGLTGSPVLVKATTTMAGFPTDHPIDNITQGVINMLPEITLPLITEIDSGTTEIEYTVGETDPANVPASIRQAVLLLASHWYRNREAVVTDQRRGTGVELPYGAEALTRSFRIPNVNISPNEC